ncbi:hypothetical protein [Neobacillus sp. D3-1R]|uniref:hypothetical protein n=1 Tax=Neobacillus sp. D3-1R TaxID=3445778 RepID=UPI003FA0504D
MATHQNDPLAMKHMGDPEEMSPINDMTNTKIKAPVVEVNHTHEIKDFLEIRSPRSVTVF